MVKIHIGKPRLKWEESVKIYVKVMKPLEGDKLQRTGKYCCLFVWKNNVGRLILTRRRIYSIISISTFYSSTIKNILF